MSDSLELVLQLSVSHHVGAGIELVSFGIAASALDHWAVSTTLLTSYYFVTKQEIGFRRQVRIRKIRNLKAFKELSYFCE